MKPMMEGATSTQLGAEGAEQANQEQRPHIEHHTAVDGVGAHHAHHHEARVEQVLGHHDDLGDVADRKVHDPKHHQVGDHQAQHHGVPDILVLVDEQRPNLNALQCERADEHSGGAVAGNAQRQQGNQCTAVRPLLDDSEAMRPAGWPVPNWDGSSEKFLACE